MNIERGPGWLFVRMAPNEWQVDNLAERLWNVLNQHFVYRLVLEMDDVDFMPSLLMGQLVRLHKRIIQNGGALRLCGLSPDCEQALHICRLDQALPHFQNRADAVHGGVVARV